MTEYTNPDCEGIAWTAPCVEVKPYFAYGNDYPVLIGVRKYGDEHELAYVPKAELASAIDERDRLRELVRYMHRCYVMGHDWGPYGAPEKQHVEDSMRELGIEVD